jgi:hypothetical protein
MITATQRRLQRPEYNLEVAGSEPPIHLMLDEMEQAQADMNWYLRRNEHAYNWAHSRWDGQTLDGRKHGDNPFPWRGASDARPRTVATYIGEQVMLMKWAYMNAKVQADALRPVVYGRQSKKASTLLRWVIYTQLRAELQRELPLAWWWRQTYGAAFLWIGWDRSRRLELMPLTMADLYQLVEMQEAAGANPKSQTPNPNGGEGEARAMLEAMMDPEQEEQVAILIQSFSEILDKDDARKIVRDLREKGTAMIPLARVFRNQPCVSALRPAVNVIFPAGMSDPQSTQTRWMALLEPVNETQLKGRIQSDNYDPGFVAEAIGHKGEVYNETWLGRTEAERSGAYEGELTTGPWHGESTFRNSIQLVHFYHYAIHFKTPCFYHTVFSPFVKGRTKDKPLYALHTPFEFDHEQMPFIGMKRQRGAATLLGSIGIAEEAYTDEQALKAQIDGVTDRTSLVNKPPLTVPQSRMHAIVNDVRPGGVLGTQRNNEVGWLELPPFDKTPFDMMTFVVQNLDRRYPLFGAEVDPELKQMARQDLANDTLIEIELMVGQILPLLPQYMSDEEIAGIVGPMGEASPKSQNPNPNGEAEAMANFREELKSGHNIIVAVNMRMMSEEWVDKTITSLGKAMTFNQGGTANTNAMLKVIMNMIDPDFADAIDDQEPATEREKQEELGALNSLMNGIEAPLPMFGNHRLRRSTLVENTFESPNPEMAKRLQNNPDTVQLIQKRLEFFQNQLQQYEQNPGIGRALSTQTFRPKMAPELAAPAAS